MFLLDIWNEIIALFFEMAPYLMLGLIFVGLLKLFFNKDMIVRHVGKNNFSSVFKAALFGVPLPLCSCGVIPTAVYMSKNGASRSSVISFLISTPQTGIDSIIATYGLMGWVFALFRPFAALIMGIIGGLAVMFFNKDNAPNLVKHDNCSDGSCSSEKEIEKTMPMPDRIKEAVKYSFFDFLDDISVQFIIGLVIAGIIAFLLPDGFFTDSAFSGGLPGMLLMIAVGVPMYICATASIPIALTLMMKGLSPGVAFVFLAVGPATNAASIAVLANTIGKKTTGIYLLAISLSAIIMGYLLDWIFTFTAGGSHSLHAHILHTHGEESFISPEVKLVIGFVFLILLLMSIYRKKIAPRLNRKVLEMENNVTKVAIDGMTCNHCVQNVHNAITKVDGVENVEVSLADKSAIVKGPVDLKQLQNAIEAVGYKVVG